MVWATRKTKLPRQSGREIRELRDEEPEGTVVIPLVVRLVPIRVEPLTIIVTVRIEHVRVAIGICAPFHPCHHPPNTLGVESDMRSLIVQKGAPSIFIFY